MNGSVAVEAPDALVAPLDPSVRGTSMDEEGATQTTKRDATHVDTTAWPVAPPAKKIKSGDKSPLDAAMHADAADGAASPAAVAVADPDAPPDGTSPPASQAVADPKEDADAEDAGKGDAAKEDAAKEEAAKDDPKEEAIKDDAAKEVAGKEDAAKEDAAKEDAAKEDAAKEDAAKDDAAKDDAAKDEATKKDAANEEAVKDEAGKADADEQEATKEAAPATDANAAIEVTAPDATVMAKAHDAPSTEALNLDGAVTSAFSGKGFPSLLGAPVTALKGMQDPAMEAHASSVWANVAGLASWKPLTIANTLSKTAELVEDAHEECARLAPAHLDMDDFKSTLSVLLAAPVSTLIGVSPEAAECLSAAGVTSVQGLASWGPASAAVAIASAAPFAEEATVKGLDAPKKTADNGPVATQTAVMDGTPAPGVDDVVSTEENDNSTEAVKANGVETPTALMETDKSEAKADAAQVGGDAEEPKDKEVVMSEAAA